MTTTPLSRHLTDTFAHMEPSYLSAHQSYCCRWGIDHLDALFYQWPRIELALAAVPRIINWGAVTWPLFYCQLSDDEGSFHGDCGVHAAIASNVLSERKIGHQRASIVIDAGATRTEHWRSAWRRQAVDDRWLDGDLAYHEVLKVGSRFWDPTEARWFDGPGSELESGRVVAVRIDNERDRKL